MINNSNREFNTWDYKNVFKRIQSKRRKENR